jgi:hypothetical protein
MNLNELSSKIISSAINVHKELGPGLLESVYQSCMVIGSKVNEQGFRLDLLVENTIIVELKAVEKVQPVHKKQLLTYLRLANNPLGLLINFNEQLGKRNHKNCQLRTNPPLRNTF